jgi:hypothetical protein
MDLDKLYFEPFQAIFQQCTVHESMIENEMINQTGNNTEKTSYFALPTADPSNQEEYIRFLEYMHSLHQHYTHRYISVTDLDWIPLKAVELFQASLGQEKWNKRGVKTSVTADTNINTKIDIKNTDYNGNNQQEIYLEDGIKYINIPSPTNTTNKNTNKDINTHLDIYSENQIETNMSSNETNSKINTKRNIEANIEANNINDTAYDPSYDFIPLLEDRHNHPPFMYERRQKMLSHWLMSLTAHQGMIMV